MPAPGFHTKFSAASFDLVIFFRIVRVQQVRNSKLLIIIRQRQNYDPSEHSIFVVKLSFRSLRTALKYIRGCGDVWHQRKQCLRKVGYLPSPLIRTAGPCCELLRTAASKQTNKNMKETISHAIEHGGCLETLEVLGNSMHSLREQNITSQNHKKAQ